MSEANSSRRTMEDFGEKGFLAELLPRLSPHPSFINGFGDDASAISIGNGKAIIFKIDRAATPIAARRGWTDYRMWGRLAVTTNCSDILAGGGTPRAVMIAMILPRDWPTTAAVEIVEGCAEECAANDIAFAGGDTKEGQCAELIGSAIGIADRDDVLTRRGAKPGDLLVLAGTLGGFLGSYLQILRSLENGLPGALYNERWLDYISHPRARWSEGAFIRDARAARSAMDSSDGLYDSVSSLAHSYGAEIDLDSLPYHEYARECSAKLGIPLFNLGLGVGDWNIVYVFDRRRWADIEGKANASGLQLTVIGRIAGRPGLRWHDGSGRTFSCKPIVNEHFNARQEDEGSRGRGVGSVISRLRNEQMLHPIAP